MWVLIVVILSLSNISEPAMLAHKVFPTEAACIAAAERFPENPGLRIVKNCVSSKDLLDQQ